MSPSIRRTGHHGGPAELVTIGILYVLTPVLLAVFTQRGALTLEGLSFAVACALPFVVLAWWGHLSLNGKPAYPSLPWLVLTCWLVYVEPSMIIVSVDSEAMFDFDESGVFWGRIFFLIWLWLCAAIVGRAANRSVQWNLHRPEYIVLSTISLVLFWAAFTTGHLIFYMGLDVPTAGSATSIVTLLALMFLRVMVGVHSLALFTGVTRRYVAAPLLLVTLLFAFTSASRSLLISSIMLLVAVLRFTEVRPTVRLLGTGAGVAVALLLLVVVYRNQMASDRDAFWSSPFAAMASSTDVVAQTRENLAVRWSHGPQFFAVVSNYLSRGAAWSDTWKEGAIGALPTLIVPDKAARANEYVIEFDLVATGRFPFVDLAPMPWLHAVFDYGVIGLAVCACFFGFALRWLDRAMAARPVTWARWFVLTSVFSVLAVPETKLDTIVVALREPIWIAALLAIGAESVPSGGVSSRATKTCVGTAALRTAR